LLVCVSVASNCRCRGACHLVTPTHTRASSYCPSISQTVLHGRHLPAQVCSAQLSATQDTVVNVVSITHGAFLVRKWAHWK
jgi:hypothetical protein